MVTENWWNLAPNAESAASIRPSIFDQSVSVIAVWYGFSQCSWLIALSSTSSTLFFDWAFGRSRVLDAFLLATAVFNLKHREGSQRVLDLVSLRATVTVVFKIPEIA